MSRQDAVLLAFIFGLLRKVRGKHGSKVSMWEFRHGHEVDQPYRGTTGAPSMDQQYQVERDWRSPAMSSSTMRRAL